MFSRVFKRITSRLPQLRRSFAASVVYKSPTKALEAAKFRDGMSVAVGGFGLCGVPQTLINAVDSMGFRDLTVISDGAGTDNLGPGVLLSNGKVRRMIASYLGHCKIFEQLYMNGELEVELCPQGSLAERLRAGGAGIEAFFTPTGAGTLVAQGGIPIKRSTSPDLPHPEVSDPRETRMFRGRECVMETALFPDIALVKAWKADTFGNLVFHGTANNFNADCAKAARHTIVEVEELVQPGELDPATVHVPSVYVQSIVHCPGVDKPIEVLTNEETQAQREAEHSERLHHRSLIGRRVALEFEHGMNVNLGVGIPVLASNYLPEGMRIFIQSENGLLGMGPYPPVGQEDPDIINAGKETVTMRKGSSLFGSSESFGMIRGGHLNMTVLGAMEVSATGDLANWIIPGKKVKGMGGAMDLVSSGSRVVVATEHTTKRGLPKIMRECSLPVTGKAVADLIVTELAVFTVDPVDGLTLVEVCDGVSVDEVREKTDAPFIVSDSLKAIPYAADP